MSPVWVLAGRERRALMASRGYRVTTLLGLVAALALAALGGWAASRQGPAAAGARLQPAPLGGMQPAAGRGGEGALAVVVDRAGVLTEEDLAALAAGSGLTWARWEALWGGPLPEDTPPLRRLVERGVASAYLLADRRPAPGGRQLAWRLGGVPQAAEWLPVVARVADRAAARARLRAAGLSPEAAEWVLAPARVQWDGAVSPQAAPGPGGPEVFPATAGGRWGVVSLFMVYGMLVVYGTATANGVAAEKGGRVVESLLSAVTPRELMAGRLWGTAQAALAQWALWAAAAVGGAALVGPAGEAAAAARLAGWASVALVAALPAHLPLFVAAGARAARPEEVAHSSWLALALLVGGYLAGLVTLGQPAGAWARYLTVVPLWGPLVVLARVSVTPVPPLQLVGSAGVAAVTALVAWRWAEGVYARWVLAGSGAPWRAGWRRWGWPWRQLAAPPHGRTAGRTDHPSGPGGWPSGE